MSEREQWGNRDTPALGWRGGVEIAWSLATSSTHAEDPIRPLQAALGGAAAPTRRPRRPISRQRGGDPDSRPSGMPSSVALRVGQDVADGGLPLAELPCLEQDVGLLILGPAEEQDDPAHLGRQRRPAPHDQMTR
jgi:hypothetical protein